MKPKKTTSPARKTLSLRKTTVRTLTALDRDALAGVVGGVPGAGGWGKPTNCCG